MGRVSDMRASRRLWIVLVGALLLAPLLSSAPAHAQLTTKMFQTPSGNVGCAIFSGTLRCDILSGLNPEPQGDCELDWTGLFVKASGKAGPVCAGDTVYDPDAPVLAYGGKWKRKGIMCRSRRSGLTCTNKLDHGFFLSRNSWRTF